MSTLLAKSFNVSSVNPKLVKDISEIIGIILFPINDSYFLSK